MNVILLSTFRAQSFYCWSGLISNTKGKSIKSIKGLRLTSFLPNKLAHHSIMDSGRRHKPPGSETKDIITHIPENSMSCISAPCSQVPWGWHRWSQIDGCTCSVWIAGEERNPERREHRCFLRGSKHACPLLQREVLSLSSKAVH